MRLSVAKKSHQELLLDVAASLRSSDPKDGLEHILNCWLSPCVQAPAASPIPLSPVPDADDLSALASWD